MAATVPGAINRDGVLTAGLRETYTNKTFYAVGLMPQPNGGEPLEARPEADQQNMVFHSYVLVRGFGRSETIRVTATWHQRLTAFPRQPSGQLSPRAHVW